MNVSHGGRGVPRLGGLAFARCHLPMTRVPQDPIEQDVTAENRQRFARNFKAARMKAGLTQSDVADLIGRKGEAGQGYISKIERGVQNLTLDMMGMVAKAIGTTVQGLLSSSKNPKPAAVPVEPPAPAKPARKARAPAAPPVPSKGRTRTPK